MLPAAGGNNNIIADAIDGTGMSKEHKECL